MIRSELCPVTTADVLSGLKQPLGEMGYSFSLEGNFRRLKRIMAKFDKPVTEHFDPDFTDFTPATAFYLLVRSGDGDVVATNAFRLYQLGGMSLAEFAVVAFARIYSHRSAKRVTLRKKQIRLFEKIREDTIYGGEMFVHPDHRRSGIGNVLAQYGIICAFWYWPSARHMFAFMEKESIHQGFSATTGFTSHYKLGIRWKAPPTQIPHDYWTVYQSLEDTVQMIETLDTEMASV